MNEEQAKKIIEAAPLLYRGPTDGKNGRSFDAFGFECNSGWYQLLYDLSIALEKEIQKQPDHRIICNIPKYSFKNLIRHIYWIGEYSIYLFIWLCKDIYNYIYWPVARGHILKLFWNPPDRPRVNGEMIQNSMEDYIFEAEDMRLKAVQVKSKYASLRFYTDGIETSKIRKLIDQAEQKSYTVCEVCGNNGKTRPGSWMETLCETCFISRENNKLMSDILE